MINALAADSTISDCFLQAIRDNQSVSYSVGNFVELLPVFDVRRLRQEGIFGNNIETRRERITYYLDHLDQNANHFALKCWKRHLDAKEAMLEHW